MMARFEFVLPLVVVLIAMVSACLASRDCPTNYTDMAKVCMATLEEHFSNSVDDIMARNKEGISNLCRKYEDFYQCLHEVLDPCQGLGAFYFNVLQKPKERVVGKYCPNVQPQRRRGTKQHIKRSAGSPSPGPNFTLTVLITMTIFLWNMISRQFLCSGNK